jgi:hypothetical protein
MLIFIDVRPSPETLGRYYPYRSRESPTTKMASVSIACSVRVVYCRKERWYVFFLCLIVRLRRWDGEINRDIFATAIWLHYIGIARRRAKKDAKLLLDE